MPETRRSNDTRSRSGTDRPGQVFPRAGHMQLGSQQDILLGLRRNRPPRRRLSYPRPTPQRVKRCLGSPLGSDQCNGSLTAARGCGDHARRAEFLTLIAFDPTALEAVEPDQLRAAVDTLAQAVAQAPPSTPAWWAGSTSGPACPRSPLSTEPIADPDGTFVPARRRKIPPARALSSDAGRNASS